MYWQYISLAFISLVSRQLIICPLKTLQILSLESVDAKEETIPYNKIAAVESVRLLNTY